MKNIAYIIITFIIIIIVFVLLRGNEDDWICQNGNWVKHGNPSQPAPTSFCK